MKIKPFRYGKIQDHDLAIKDKFFPSKQFVNVTGLITLKMRLKPGFVKLRAGIF